MNNKLIVRYRVTKLGNPYSRCELNDVVLFVDDGPESTEFGEKVEAIRIALGIDEIDVIVGGTVSSRKWSLGDGK